MHEHLLERIRVLELANRRWKAATLGLGVALLILLVIAGLATSLSFHAVFMENRAIEAVMQDRIAVERMMAIEARERAEAERERAEAERARGEEARQKQLP